MSETFPYPRTCPFAVPPQYPALMADGLAQVTLAGSGQRVWAVTGHRTIRQLLTDPRVSASREHPNFPFYGTVHPPRRTEASFVGYDPPAHTDTRRRAAAAFTMYHAQRLRPRIARIVDERIAAMAELTPPVDFHEVFSLPVAMAVICELLDVPAEHRGPLLAHGSMLLPGYGTDRQRADALRDRDESLRRLIATREREPGDDLLSRIIDDFRRADGEYSPREVFNLVRLLVVGGHETTASMLTLGTACLLDHPDELAALLADPDELIEPAVEELVRFASIGDVAVGRVAIADIPVGDQVIRAGDGIVVLLLAGNRDPEVFPEPDRLVLAHGNRRHLGFGYGVHHCIGAEVARLELQLVWTRLFRSFPTLELAKPLPEVHAKERAVIFGLLELPVIW